MEKTLKFLENGVKSGNRRFIYTRIDGEKLNVPAHVPKGWFRFQPPNLPQVKPTEFLKIFEAEKKSDGSYVYQFHGENSPMGPNLYGGLMYAQALLAAQNEVDQEFRPTSFHGLYVGPSDTQKPMDYQVKKLRDGKSFSARYVEGRQDGKVVFAGLGNFYKPFEPTMIHSIEMPKVPPPEECQDMYEFLEESLKRHENGEERLDERTLSHIQRRYFDKETNITDFRFVNPRAYFFVEPYKNDPVQYWFKTRVPLTDPKLPKIIHQLIISYVSDQTMASCNVGPHLSHGHDAAHATSLDHTIWFHNFDFRADDWIFINAQSPNADSGTAFGACSIWTRDGKLIASGGQESLARLKTLSKL